MSKIKPSGEYLLNEYPTNNREETSPAEVHGKGFSASYYRD